VLPALSPPLELLTAPLAVKELTPTRFSPLAILVSPVPKVLMVQLFVALLLLLALNATRASTVHLVVLTATLVLLDLRALMASCLLIVPARRAALPVLMALTALPAPRTALFVLLDRKELEFPLINELMLLLLALFVLLVLEAVLAQSTAPPVSREPTLSETLTLALVVPKARKA